MISVKKLSFAYTADVQFSFPDVNCAANNNLLIIGDSGKGKTTLLHLLAGLLQPTSGSITINDTDIASLSDRALDRFRGDHIGIVFQRPHFVNALSLEENLLLAQYLSGNKQDRIKVKNILEQLGLGHRLKNKTHNLSEGEKQRASIARALINDPTLILADEPTSSLDDTNADKVITLLEEQASKAGAALIVVTHDQRIKERFQNQLAL